LKYFETDRGILYNQDCFDVMSNIPEKSVNTIIADPPYFEIKGDFDFIFKDFDDYLEFIEKQAKEYKRILADNGSLFIYGHAKRIAYIQIIFDKYFNLENSLIWEKKECQTKKGAFNFRSFAPVTERILFYGNEWDISSGALVANKATLKSRDYIRDEILRAKGKIKLKEINIILGVATNGGGVASSVLSTEKTENTFITEEHYETIKKWLNNGTEYEYLRTEYEDLRTEYEDLRRPFQGSDKTVDILKFSQESTITGKYKHPTQKPPKLTQHLLRTTTRENNTVYIPFGGSGVECEACEILNLKWISSEIEPKYCEIIKKRLETQSTNNFSGYSLF